MFRNPTTDLIVILVIVLLIFGPKRLPSLGRQLGEGLREFKDSITGDSKDSEEGERPEIARSSAAPLPQSPEGAPAAPAPPRDPTEVAAHDAASPPRDPTEVATAAPPRRESAEIGSERSS